jgi:hypothetical protein
MNPARNANRESGSHTSIRRRTCANTTSTRLLRRTEGDPGATVDECLLHKRLSIDLHHIHVHGVALLERGIAICRRQERLFVSAGTPRATRYQRPREEARSTGTHHELPSHEQSDQSKLMPMLKPDTRDRLHWRYCVDEKSHSKSVLDAWVSTRLRSKYRARTRTRRPGECKSRRRRMHGQRSTTFSG